MESRSLVHLSSSSVYYGWVCMAGSGTDIAGVGVVGRDGSDMLSWFISIAATVVDATKCYEWVYGEGGPFRQH